MTNSPKAPRPAPKRALLLAVALALAACGKGGEERRAFRATARPIYSNASLSPAALAGRWSQTAAFTNTPGKGCRSGGAQIEPTAAGIALRARLCLDGEAHDLSTPLASTGPGRLTPTAKAPAPLNRQWWVLWADTDLRTVVIGTPDGSFGFILNRDGTLPPDRLAAARQVLAFNGYDTTRLQSW